MALYFVLEKLYTSLLHFIFRRQNLAAYSFSTHIFDQIFKNNAKITFARAEKTLLTFKFNILGNSQISNDYDTVTCIVSADICAGILKKYAKKKQHILKIILFLYC